MECFYRWVSIAGGAQLMIGNRSECQNVSGLGGIDGIWAQRGITVVNAVPTLINIMTSLDDDSKLPSTVRLLNLGGEACPSALVNRLWHKDLRILNTYGPSETTVTATYQELFPNEAVTIGKPLPGYHVLLLPIADDDDLSSQGHVLGEPIKLAVGVEGELCIGGPCLGKGYVQREELTAEKFIAHPMAIFPGERLYRSGDRVKLDVNYNILFLGRIDNQVKHRGFRIELGEIENALANNTNVQTAAVILSSAMERLEAYIVIKGEVDIKILRSSLSSLPTYMQPEAYFFLLPEEMPRLPSGKINVKALQEISIQNKIKEIGEKEETQINVNVDESSILGQLLKAMSNVFPQAGQIEPTADFFDDLGGHSLVAAILVSKLRKESDPESPLASIGLQDIYICRTAAKLAEKYTDVDDDDDCIHSNTFYKGEYSLLQDSSHGGPTGKNTGDHWPVSQRAFVLCGMAQLPALVFFFFLASIEFLLPYIVFDDVLHRADIGYAILAGYAAFVIIPVFYSLIGILGKWIVLGKAKEGEYPLYGVYYYRFWLAERFVELVNTAGVADGPMHSILLRTLGAQVGHYCHVGQLTIGAAFDLVEIGNDVVIGEDVLLATSVVERGRMILKRVVIGSNAHIGSSSLLEGGSRIEDGGELAALSMLPDGAVIPTSQQWHGSPAQYLGESPHVGLSRATRSSFTRRSIMAIAMVSTSTFIFPLLYFAPQLPGLLMFEVLNIRNLTFWQQTGLFAMPASMGYIFLVFVEMLFFRWIILGKVKEGSHYTSSFYFYRHWFVNRIMAMCLIILKPVYATLYVVPFMRCLGVKVGNWAEISTARGIQFELTEIGDESFIADNVLMGAPEIRGNRLILKKTSLKARAFAGNSAVIPQGSTLASNTLVGVLSIAPGAKAAPLQSGQSCFGTPPVLMPARQQGNTCHAAHLLYRPKASQIATRLFIEGMRIWLPRLLVVLGLGFGLQIAEFLFARIDETSTFLLLPLFYFALFVLPALITVAACKWILIGRYEPAEWPLWSRKVWLSEFVTSLYESLLEPLFTNKLIGTPYLAMVFRLLGVKVGSRVTMLSSDITEFDMVQLGDEAVINRHAGPQTHLFEDRVMKVGHVHLGKGACMKPYSICLPNSSIASHGQLGSLSLLMKGESIPANQAWEGTPIAPRNNRERAPFVSRSTKKNGEDLSALGISYPVNNMSQIPETPSMPSLRYPARPHFHSSQSTFMSPKSDIGYKSDDNLIRSMEKGQSPNASRYTNSSIFYSDSPIPSPKLAP